MSAPVSHRRTTSRDRLRDALFLLVGAILISAIALVSNDRAHQAGELSPPLRSADEPTTHTHPALASTVVPMTDEESRESAQRAALAAADAADEAARAANNSDPQ
jgi:hypothetical protein